MNTIKYEGMNHPNSSGPQLVQVLSEHQTISRVFANYPTITRLTKFQQPKAKRLRCHLGVLKIDYSGAASSTELRYHYLMDLPAPSS